MMFLSASARDLDIDVIDQKCGSNKSMINGDLNSVGYT